MRILKFNVEKQVITKDPACDFGNIVKGTKGYLEAVFSFTEEWEGCKKAAVFKSLVGETAMPIYGNKCDIPEEALKYTSFSVRIVGEKDGYRITTNKCDVRQEG